MNFREVLNRLKIELKYDTDAQIADYLGITQSTIASWKLRNSPNWDIILNKIANLDVYFILYGVRSMKENADEDTQILIKTLLHRIKELEGKKTSVNP